MSPALDVAPERDARFADLGLPDPIGATLERLGYERPTPVQRDAVPPLLAGRDLVGRAPTGTGKTAAFALPLLARLSGRRRGGVRALVLTPTRELAIQVAAAFDRYAVGLGLHTLAVYGGQEYAGQIRRLARGVDVVVGTPGRVMDHVRRGTLALDGLEALVLDEGDEMLRMGFIDDVEWLIERTPATRQTALFSATMPPRVRRIAERHLKDPLEVSIGTGEPAASTVRQRVLTVSAPEKTDALVRVLEVEPFDAALVFVRTRLATTEVAERLQGAGVRAAAINGEMAQRQREQCVERLKRGGLDVLVATDVVARGLDVERVSLVVNHDVPSDVEAYVHRIGRTGRAGRPGEAILFVTPRERRLLGAIERATRQRIGTFVMPSVEQVEARRVADVLGRAERALAAEDLGALEGTLERWCGEREVSPARLAAALARLALGERPSPVAERPGARVGTAPGTRAARPAPAAPAPSAPARAPAPTPARARAAPAPDRREPPPGDVPPDADRPSADRPSADRPGAPTGSGRAAPARHGIEMERFRVEVGAVHGAAPANLVGAIASEADIEAAWIGKIDVRDDHSVVELPVGMPKFLLKRLRRTWVCGRRLDIARLAGDGGPRPVRAKRAAKG